MKHLIRLVATDRDIKIQERGRQDTGGREKDRFPVAAVRPRVIRFLIYGERLMLLVRRERKRKGQFPKLRMCLHKNAGASDRVIRGEYILLLSWGFVESIKPIHHRVIRINIIHTRWRSIVSAIARDFSIRHKLLMSIRIMKLVLLRAMYINCALKNFTCKISGTKWWLSEEKKVMYKKKTCKNILYV